MPNTPLLSICIPTYNREKFLKEILYNIVNQDGFDEESIDIVISDNASVDGTRELAQNYMSRYKNIRYSRNDTNLGADRNVLKALSLAKWRYIWWVTDDDIIFPGWLQEVIKVLEENKDDNIAMFQVNFNSLDKHGNLLRESFLGKNLQTKIYPSVHDLYQSYEYLHNWLTFFSINIFHSSILDFDIASIPVTNFPHSCIMWLISHKKAMFIGSSIIGYRTDNNSDNFWSIRYFFYVFVICHLRYMIFLRRYKSCISQYELTIILIKMIVYSVYLLFKKYSYKILHSFR